MTTTQPERAAAPPTNGLVRMASFALRADGDAGDGNTLDGYAAVFNSETVIDSWEGRFKEKISPGAMRKSFSERTPVIQFDHGQHPLVGSIPIARFAEGYPREEAHPELAPHGGARIVAPLHQNWLIEPVRDAIRSGSVDGMSFRFSVVRDEWTDHTGRKITDATELRDLLERSWRQDVPDDKLLVRTLREVKVHELGPVVFPAYSDTSVGVRSKVTIDLARLDDPEQRSLLARAVLMADQAEAEGGDETPPQDTDAPTEGSPAVEHEAESTPDTPRSTGAQAGETAGEHESTMTRFDVRHALDDMGLDDTWRTIIDTKGRYAR